jgi:hypothetical protein
MASQILTKCTTTKTTFIRLLCEKYITMMNRFVALGLILFHSVYASTSQAQDAVSFSLELQSGAFQIPADEDRVLTKDELASWPSWNGRSFGALSLTVLPSKSDRLSLQNGGVSLLSYLPDGFYLVAIHQGADIDALNAYGVEASTPFMPQFKWMKDGQSVPDRALSGDGGVRVNIRPFPGFSMPDFIQSITELGEVIEVNEVFNFITLKVPGESLHLVAESPSVFTMEWIYPYGEPENYTSRSLMRTNVLDGNNANGLSFDGSGVSVAIQDDGIVGPHIDFHGRIAAIFATDDEGDHGDHVSGTVGGAGNLNPYHRGQASGADLYIYKAYPEYSAIDSLNSHYYDYNLFITSTSYSDGCNAGYTARSQTVDEQSADMSSLVHVYSAGNAGTSNCGYGAGTGWGNITGGHKMGKNTIAVGNLNQVDQLANSSSRGPAYDGRIKPDICAKGTAVTSTIANNLYDTYSGTSMACPNVAGSLALLYEAFENLNGGAPDAGLVKAVVLNTADDLGNEGPDFKHGWGRLNARKAYQLISEGAYVIDSVASGGGVNAHAISVPANASELRVMLYWTDPAANVNAATALVNDLDLKAYTPSFDSLKPYVLNSLPIGDSLDLPATTGVDHLNNVEQIRIQNPAPGTFICSVSPYNVPFGPQTYYLVYWVEQDPLVLTYPVGGEEFAPYDTELIRWDAALSGTVDVEYSVDGGNSWNTISSGVPVEMSYVSWVVPNTAEGDVRVRLVHDSISVLSQDFSIMTSPSNLSIAWACPDSIGVQWEAVNDALGYDVYKLGQKYMDSIGSSSTTLFVDYTSNPYSNNLWYSASSIGAENARSKRTIAIKKQPGLQNCFLANDLSVIHMEPDLSLLFSCYGDSLDVSFVVENTGVTPSGSFDATLYGPNGVVLTEGFTASIAPMSLDTFFFSSPLPTPSALVEYTLVVDLPGDQNAYNDSVFRAYKPVLLASLPPLWTEDFDQYDDCTAQPTCGQAGCDIPDGWINLENGLFDDEDWRVHSGTTPTQFTGPFGDHTQVGGGGKYVYLEATGNCVDREGVLLSPCIDLSESSGALLTFYYNMYGVQMGDLHVDVFNGEAWDLDVIPALSGNQGTSWQVKIVDLSEYSGGSINVRFRGVLSDGALSDMALDDISVSHLPIANFNYEPQLNGQTVTFTDLSVYVDSMSFDLGDGSALLDSVPHSHDYSQQTSYTVDQFVSNAFGQDHMVKEIVNLGSVQTTPVFVQMAPNPTVDVVNISWPLEWEVRRVDVWASDGRCVMTQVVSGGDNLDLDLRNLSNGAYFVRLLGTEIAEMRVLVAHE